MTGRQKFDSTVKVVGYVHSRTGDRGGPAGRKLLRALAAVTDRIPDDDLAELAARNLIIAPLDWAKENARSWAYDGDAPACAGPLWAEGDDSPAGWLVAIDNRYEDLARRKAIGVLSHELAHVFLRHGEQHGDSTTASREAEAWQQQVRWGFGRFVIRQLEEALRQAEIIDLETRALIERELPKVKQAERARAADNGERSPGRRAAQVS